MKKTADSTRRCAPTWKRSLLRVLTCAIFALAMTSCGTGIKATRAEAPKANAPPPPPPPALQANQRGQCPQLPLATSSAPLALAANHDEVTALYRECSARRDSLEQAMDEWRSTAWRWYCQAVVASGLRVTDCPHEEK